MIMTHLGIVLAVNIRQAALSGPRQEPSSSYGKEPLTFKLYSILGSDPPTLGCSLQSLNCSHFISLPSKSLEEGHRQRTDRTASQ